MPSFKEIYLRRDKRLLVMFSLVLIFNLITSLFFPLYVLIIGPIIYGIPHLFSSVRYLSYALGPENNRFISNAFLGSMFIAVTLMRFSVSEESINPELISLIVTVIGLGIIHKKLSLKSLFVASTCVMVAWFAPLWVAGLLILVHNAVAFIYWIHASKTPAEKRAALISTGMFLMISGLIFLGAFDGVYSWYSPAGLVSELDYTEIGKFIIPWSSDYKVWFHAVVVYAFGQSLHYFVWMKAIPDQYHSLQAPASFTRTAKLLKRDFGSKYLFIIFLVTMIMGICWMFLSLSQGRMIYFAVAAYHGYMELGALILLKKNP